MPYTCHNCYSCLVFLFLVSNISSTRACFCYYIAKLSPTGQLEKVYLGNIILFAATTTFASQALAEIRPCRESNRMILAAWQIFRLRDKARSILLSRTPNGNPVVEQNASHNTQREKCAVISFSRSQWLYR